MADTAPQTVSDSAAAPVAPGMYPAGGADPDVFYRVDENNDVWSGRYSNLGPGVQIEAKIGNTKGLAQTVWDATIGRGAKATPPAPAPAAAAPPSATPAGAAPPAGQTPPPQPQPQPQPKPGEVGDKDVFGPTPGSGDGLVGSPSAEAAQPGQTPPPPKGPQPKPGEVGDKEVFGSDEPTPPPPPPNAPPPPPGVDPNVMAQARQAAASKNPLTDPLRAAGNGMLWGFEPDIKGAGAYVGQAIKNGFAGLTGQEPGAPAGQVGAAVAAAEREQQNLFTQEHPIASTGLGIGGAMLNPLTYVGGDYIAGAKGAGAAVRGAQVAAAQGAIQGAGSAGGNLGQRAKGAAEGGIIGGVLGAVAHPIAGAVKGVLGTDAVKTGMAVAKHELDRLGLALPKAGKGILHGWIEQGKDPVQAAHDAVASSQPGKIPGTTAKIPLSKGEMSGNPKDLGKQKAAIEGKAGGGAQRHAAAHEEAKTGAIKQVGQNVKGRIAQGQHVEPGQGGAQVSGELNARAAEGKAKYKESYRAAEEASAGSKISASDAKDIFNRARYGLTDKFGAGAGIKQTLGVLRDVEKGLGEAGGNLPNGVKPEDLAKMPQAAADAIRKASGAEGGGASLKDLFNARSRLSQIARTPPNPLEGAAASEALKHLDAAMQDAMDKDLFSGDPKALDMWKHANGEYAQWQQDFRGNDLVHKLTATSPRGGDYHALIVDPREATNLILGSSQLKGLGASNMARDMAHLKQVLGPNSDALASLKAEAFDRILHAGGANGPGPVSGGDMGALWSNAQTKYKDVINGLYTPTERQQISNYVGSASRATTPPASIPPGASGWKTFIDGVGSMAKLGRGVASVSHPVAAVASQVGQSAAGAGQRMLASSAMKAATQNVAPAAARGVVSPAIPGILARTVAQAAPGQGVRGSLEAAGGP
jgi:hypothetical protein